MFPRTRELATESRSVLAIFRVIVKIVAIVVGFAGTVLGLTSVVGLFAESGWVRFPVAVVVALAIPALLTDRLLPEDDSKGAAGLPSDVFSLTWLGFTLAFAIGAQSFTKNILVRDADRMAASGLGVLARVSYVMAGVDATIPNRPTLSPSPSASVGASATASSSASAAPPASAAPAATSAAPEIEDAGTKKSAEPSREAMTAAELFKKFAPSVVTVSVRTPRAEGGGTGFLIDRAGTIATNHHVVDGALQVRIGFMNGARYQKVELLVEDSGADLALLRIAIDKPDSGDAPNVQPLELGDSDDIKVGEPAVSIGNPLGLEHTLTDGLISARRLYKGRQWIQTSVPISPGNSGGPLFNMRGEVIGVSTATIAAMFGVGQNLNLAVPVNVLGTFIKKEYPDKRIIGQGSGAGSGHW